MISSVEVTHFDVESRPCLSPTKNMNVKMFISSNSLVTVKRSAFSLWLGMCWVEAAVDETGSVSNSELISFVSVSDQNLREMKTSLVFLESNHINVNNTTLVQFM